MRELDRVILGFKDSVPAMFPVGIHNKVQFRDVVRIFLMSWCENLKASIELLPENGDRAMSLEADRLICLMEDPRHVAVCEPDWLPEEYWEYWE